MRMSLVQGDIVTLDVDAIVNAANSTLQGGGRASTVRSTGRPVQGLAVEARRLAPCPRARRASRPAIA